MPDANNLPEGGTGDDLSVADAADALAGIIDDPEEDNVDRKPEDAADEVGPDADEPKEGDEEKGDAKDDAEDPDKAEDEAEPDGSDKKSDGRFVEHTARVTLPDGSTTTVKDLIDGSLRQGDYTRKTTEVAESRKQADAERQRYGERTQQLDEQLAVNLQWLEMTRPQRPEVSYEEDPVAYIAFRDNADKWNEAHQWVMGHVNARKAEFEKAQQEQAAAYEERETEALYGAIPALRDPAKHRAFVSEVEKIAPEYGITAEELKGVKDHRQWLVLRDALAYRRSKARAPEVRKAIEGKPRIVKSSRRVDPDKDKQRARHTLTERLRESGSVDDGIAAIAAIPDL